MKTFSITRSAQGDTLTFGGAMTIENIARIRDALLEALDRTDELRYLFNDDIIADLSFLQLLCAAHKSAVRKNKKIIPGDEHARRMIRKVIRDAGFLQTKSCLPGRDAECVNIYGGTSA